MDSSGSSLKLRIVAWFAPVLLLACQDPEDRVPRHVVLVSMDTTRTDALGCYGNSTSPTPNLDRFAESATLFQQAIAAAPTTLASHTSMLTGVYPRTHGVPRNGFMVHPDNKILAERLKGDGFHSAAFLGSFALQTIFELHQGFDYVDEAFDLMLDGKVYDQNQRRAESVTDAALDYVDAIDADRWLLFVHYFDAHSPFNPPPPYCSLPYSKASDRMAVEQAVAQQQRRLLGQEIGYGPVMRQGLTRELLRAADGATMPLDRELAQLYEDEVAYMDHHIGRLLDGLKDRGILGDACVIITADHGESFAEHADFWNHGLWVYQTTVRVPLLIQLPGGSQAAVATPVSLVDLVPTVLSCLQLPLTSELEGQTLQPYLLGQTVEHGPVFSEATQPIAQQIEQHPWANAAKAKCIIEGNYKYTWSPYNDYQELFDLANDPKETTNLLLEETPEIIELRHDLDQKLREWMGSQETVALTFQSQAGAEVQERLRALGYVEQENR